MGGCPLTDQYHNALHSRNHCRCCVDRLDLQRNRVKPLRRSNPKSHQAVYLAVLELLDSALAQGLVEVGWYVTKEAFAAQLSVPEHFIATAFMRLNREGRLTQGRNWAPHDSTRDRWGGWDSAWSPTRYRIL